MIRNWQITAWLASPLAGDPPKLDSVLESELACRLGYLKANKLTRLTKLSEIQKPPVPLASEDIGGKPVWLVSDPIIPEPYAEWADYHTKRIDTSEALLLDPAERKNLLTGSGPYKMRRVPCRIRLIDSVTWFGRGDRAQLNKLLKKVVGIGKHINIGYGRVWRWTYEEVDSDYSITAVRDGKPVLMKTIPLCDRLIGVGGYTRSYGGAWPPYWHPENATDIAVPA